ncbi:MAG TPA: glycosyltransferase family 39 protein [Candidatus Binatia bacterium]
MSDRHLLQAIILLVFLRLVSASLIDLSPQEAYYWNYAKHPALSYFDHPPVVAWLISAGQLVLGKTELGVRVGGFLLTLLSTGLLYALGKLWFGRRAGLWAALLFQLLPLYFVYGVLSTPDVPLNFFWLLTLYLISIAVRGGKKWAWYAAGIAFGLCMLSKYTAVFLLPSTLLLLAIDSRYHQWFIRKEPYLALLIAALCFTPVILWNMEHGWVSFGFQINDRLSRRQMHPLRSVGEFVLVQLGVTYPALIAALVMIPTVALSLAVKARRLAWRFCLLFSLPLLTFLLLFSIHSRIKANWTLPAYLSLLIAAYPSYRYLRFKSAVWAKLVAKYVLISGFYILPVMYVVTIYHLTITIPGIPAFSFTTGWKDLAKEVGQEAQDFEHAEGTKVFLLGLDSHYIAAVLAFYTDDGREVFSRNLVGKPALAFAYWPPKIDPRGFNALAVDTDPPELESLQRYFTRVDEKIQRIPIVRGGRVLDYFYVVKCFGYKGHGR